MKSLDALTPAEQQAEVERVTRKIIDADRNVVLGRFHVQDTEAVLALYEADERWNDVGVDRDGDIILWEDV